MVPLGALEPAWPFMALVFGLVIGSFANVCIHRLPLGESVVTPPSHCPRCRTRIGPLDNIPLLSYVFLGGRCRVCRAPIAARYPLVELGNGLLYFGVAETYGLTGRGLLLMAFATAMLILALIDLDYQILPDVITLPGVVVGVAASLLEGPPSPLESVASAAAGYAAFMAIALVWRSLRGIEALGQGDWKMAALLGAVLGWEKLLVTVFLATLAGSIVGLGQMLFGGRGLQHRLPLGTFLGAAALFVVFLGEVLVAGYRRFVLLQG